MFYEDNKLKATWELCVTIILIFTCLITPLHLSVMDIKGDLGWTIVNNTVDIIFLVDIFVTFNSAFTNSDFIIIDNRKKIAKTYLKGWFTIDVIAILPFHYILASGGSANGLARTSKITRMYKLIKLTRLLRILKIAKESGKFMKNMRNKLKVGIGFERLFLFFFTCTMLFHIVSCLWLMVGSYNLGEEPSWMDDGMAEETNGFVKYVNAYYWTI